MSEQLLTLEQTADLLQVNVNLLIEWVETYQVISLRLPDRSLRFRQSHIDEFLNNCMIKANEQHHSQDLHPISNTNGKYSPLSDYLLLYQKNTIRLSFKEIENIISSSLPQSASSKTWWANDRTHYQSRSWISANWKVVTVDLDNRRVQFSRIP